jgi:glycosyl hydrolase family 39 (putative alpha-L-iduronidase)
MRRLGCILAAVLVLSSTACRSADVTIDYNRNIRRLSPLAIGMAETGWRSPNVLANDARERRRLARLDLGYIRMHLVYEVSGDPTSKIVCGGSGCDTDPTGDQWISAITSAGAEPVVIVDTKSSVDAANTVRHFNVNPTTGKPDPSRRNYVRYWIIGNEPSTNGYSASSYSGYFNNDSDAMKTLDPDIKIGGPTVAWYDETWMEQFLKLSGSRVDFVDFHGYPQEGTTNGNVSSLFRWAATTGNDVSTLRRLIQSTVPSRASQIGIEVGEWSLNWGGTAQGDTNFNAVWTADVLGHILQNGGWSVYFGTKGNALKWSDGWATDDMGHTVFMHVNDPHAPYHGYGMFTGEGLFRSFGNSMVHASTTLPDVDVFASKNPKNIVAINKSQSAGHSAEFSLNGVSSATVDVWQKDQRVLFKDPPVHRGSVNVRNGTFSFHLPPMSATTFVITQPPISGAGRYMRGGCPC